MKTLRDLITQIREWSERDDLPESQLLNFIKLTEQNFKKDFYLPPNEKTVEMVVDEVGCAGIPFDYLKAKHLWVYTNTGDKRPLYRKPNEVVVVGGNYPAEDAPYYFERDAGKFIFAPKPSTGTSVWMTYYNLIPSLIDVANTDPGDVNYVFAIMPTVYLFGSLFFLHTFTMNEERATYYGKLYEQAKADLVEMQNDAEMSGSSLHVFPALFE